MEKTIFEQIGGIYTLVGDYYLSNLQIFEQETKPIGMWNQRHKRYLKQNHKVLYINLLTSAKLNSYLTNIDKQAEEMFILLVKELAENENVTEKLKAENQMLWVHQMNNIQNRMT